MKKQLAMKRPWAVRKLLSAIPTVLFLLKPCLLMSPLSVSLFLDADRIAFDVVVFDEASQIFTESAIGSLLRAKQAIIAGDTKQLPPTAFFKGLSDGDGNDDDANDDDDGISDGGEFESVLSAASACANDNRFASHPLLWHYRSRHESLIGFSREHFYEHLQTFPSAAVPSALQFDYVENGVYHGGVGNRRDNPLEAAHVAQKVAEQICAHPKQSVGVITMSEAQQNAVYAAVEKLKRSNNRLAALLNEDGPEGFFVKNIENVQGDERDVIFLSIGYGRDAKTGVFRLNFGPLNKDGGERRLNVAVTRARLRCVTVASFLPSEIDPARTDKSGPLLLRAYMERAQAQNGANSISQEADTENALCPADGFVQAVCAALQKRGYLVRQNVGLFDFRVDIGVLNDANADRFLLGILCDGAHYLSGETARAREYLRDEVLRGLEWRLLRIWSADFARNPEAVLQTIEQAIARAKSGLPEFGDAPAKAQEETADAPAGAEETTETLQNSEAAQAENTTKNTSEPLTDRDALLPGISHFVPMPEGELTDFARAFWNAEAENQATLLTDFVHAEGPVLFAAAAQKIAGAAGFARTGNRLQQTVRDAAGIAASRGEIMESDGFLWPAGLINAPPARVPAPGDTPRPIEALALEEIGAVMTALLQSAIGMSQNEAIENTARLLGYARTGPTVRERITSALSLLELSHHVHVQGGQVYTFEPNG